MADNAGSVGSISLDLIIKNKIGEQLNKIKTAAEAPAAKVGEAIENAISAPMEKAGKAVGKAVSEAINSVNEDERTGKGFARCCERSSESSYNGE